MKLFNDLQFIHLFNSLFTVHSNFIYLDLDYYLVINYQHEINY